MTTRLSLEGEVNIYRVGELRERLLAALGEEGPLELDLSQVSELDAAALQVLLSAARDAEARKKPLRVVASSPAVDEVFTLLRLNAGKGPLGAPRRDEGATR